MRFAFFDIDGTLVSFKTHAVPQSTRDAIKLLRQNNVKCFISSGRHLSNIDNLGDLQFDGYVTVNGGMTYLDGKLIDTNPIARQDVRAMLDLVYPDNTMAVSFVLKEGLVLNVNNDKTRAIFEQLKFNPLPPLTDLRTLAETDIYQMISFFNEEEEPAVMARLPHCQSARWSPIFTDLVPLGQSKVRGMSRLCQLLGVSQSDTIAFGDGGNDIEMLQWAGMGVAMGNATDSVKAVADMVCPSVDDDGILHAVKQIL